MLRCVVRYILNLTAVCLRVVLIFVVIVPDTITFIMGVAISLILLIRIVLHLLHVRPSLVTEGRTLAALAIGRGRFLIFRVGSVCVIMQIHPGNSSIETISVSLVGLLLRGWESRKWVVPSKGIR